MMGIKANACTNSSRDKTCALQKENEQLKLEIQQLQIQAKELTDKSQLSLQCDSLLQYGKQVVHGPKTPLNFKVFSLQAIIKEIQDSAPSSSLNLGPQTEINTRRRFLQSRLRQSVSTLLNA